MSRCSRSVLLLAGLVLATWATAMDGPLPVPADGVRLEAPTTTSPNIRLVIPAEEIDRRAQAEYRQIVENAAKEGALAPDNVPDPAKWLDLHMLAMPGGKERTAEEFAALFARAGLKLLRVTPTPSGMWLIEADAA